MMYTPPARSGLEIVQIRESRPTDPQVVAAPGDRAGVELGGEWQGVFAGDAGAIAELRHGESGGVLGEQFRGDTACGLDRVAVEQHLVALHQHAAAHELADRRPVGAGGWLGREAAGEHRRSEWMVGVRIDAVGNTRPAGVDRNSVELGDDGTLALVERGEVEPLGAGVV